MECACEGVIDFLSSANTPYPGLYFFFFNWLCQIFLCASDSTLHLKTQIIAISKHLCSALSLLLALPKDLVLSSVDGALDPALHNFPGGRDVLSPSHNLVLF